jgi:glycosyltransferase involved in cell wall biosynthesis
LGATRRLGISYEVVLVDDASTDNTPEILERFRLSHPENVRVVRRSTARGVAVAKNTALCHCSGRFVALLDADDEFHPDKLARCYELVRDDSVDLVTHDFYHWRSRSERVLMTPGSWMGTQYDFWPPSTWLFRNGLVRFSDQMIGSGEDLEWLWRRRSHLRRHHIALPLTTLYAHPGSTGQAVDGLTAADQIAGRMTGRPHPNDQRAPRVWVCPNCGRQLLQAVPCCGRQASAAPLYYYSFAESVRCSRAAPEFSIVLLTKNQFAVTRVAVETLLQRFRDSRFELVFVDGGSTDETIPAIREWGGRFPVKLVSVPPEEVFNYSRNCNRGARAAIGTHLLLANNDVEFCSDDLVPALRAALTDPRVGVVGVSTAWRRWHREPEWNTADAPYLFVQRPFPGYFWGMRRELYWELGGMDEEFWGYGYDELDFQYRALLGHYRLALVAGGVAHRVSTTFKAVFGRKKMSHLEYVNRVVFARKHGAEVLIRGDHVEPFCRYRSPGLSAVMVVRDAGPALRRSLEAAAVDPRAHNGSVQLVVVNNGSSDDTALVLAEYSRRLPRLVSVIHLERAVPAHRALAMARKRAIGVQVRVIQPGEGLPVAQSDP